MPLHSFSPFRFVANVTLVMLLGFSTFPVAALAQSYVPPSRGLPGRREGGGTRGNCVHNAMPLMALMPSTNFGQTIDSSPTLFWYVPQLDATVAEFVLLDDQENVVYTHEMELNGEAGVVRLTVPVVNDKSLLEVGKDYHWYFSLICDPGDRSGDIFVEGWIQRIEPDSALQAQLESASVREQANLYATSGLWHDALSTLADLRLQSSTDEDAMAAWQTLLGSVDLDAIADEALILSDLTELDPATHR